MFNFSKLILVRRMIGASMSPKLKPGQLLLATGLFRHLHPGQVVIIEKNHKQTVRRIERINGHKLFVVGDNLSASTDSRQFGWLDEHFVIGRVLRPRLAK